MGSLSSFVFLIGCVVAAVLGQTAPAPSGCGSQGYQPVRWQTIQGPLDAHAGRLNKIGGANRWDSGAISQVNWPSGSKCIDIKFQCRTSGYAMLGIGHGNTNQAYQDLDFAWYCAKGSTRIYSKGRQIGGAYGRYIASNIFQIQVVNGKVNMILNGQTKKTFTVSSWPLQIDTSIHSRGMGIYNIAYRGPKYNPPSDPCTGLSYQNVHWTGLTGNFYGPPGSYVKAGRNSAWNTGAVSVQKFNSSDCLKFVFKCPNLNTYQMIGVGHVNGANAATYASIDVALYCQKGGTLSTYQNGRRTTAGLPKYTRTDIFSMYHNNAAKSLQITQNGNQIVSWSDSVLQYPVVIDVSAHGWGSTMTGIQYLARSKIPESNPCQGLGWQMMTWKNIIGALDAHPGRLTKSGGGNGWNAGASSVMKFNTSQCLMVQFQCTTNGYTIFGVGNDDTSVNYKDINVAWYCAKGTLQTYDNGRFVGAGRYYQRTVLGISFDLETQSIWLWRDGTIQYATTKIPSGNWFFMDASLHTRSAGLFNVKYMGVTPTAPATPCTPYRNKGAAGWQPVQWTGFKGQTYSYPGYIRKLGRGGGWNTGAISTETFNQNECLEFTWQCGTQGAYTMTGVGHVSDAAAASYTSIDFAVYCVKGNSNGGNIYIYQSGSSRGGGYGKWTPSMTFKMNYTQSTNTLAAFKSTDGKTFSQIYGWSGIQFPAVIDVALHTTTGAVKNVKYLGPSTKQPPNLCGGSQWSTVTWRNIAGSINAHPGRLTRVSGGGWNAGAASQQQFNDSVCTQVRFQCPTTGYAMLGLAYGDSHQSYTDIDVAWYCAKGNANIYTKGTSRGNFGKYTASTVFQLSYDPNSNQVYLYKGINTAANAQNIPIYSWPAPQEPFLIDTSIHTKGMKLTNVQFRGTLNQKLSSCVGKTANPVQWGSLTGNAYAPPGMISVLSGGSAWSVSSSSIHTWNQGECLSFSFTCTGKGVIGLTPKSAIAATGLNSVNYGVYCMGGTAKFVTKGSGTATVSYIPGRTTFTISMDYQANTLKVYKDGSSVFSWPSSSLSQWPYMIDSALYTTSSKFQNVRYMGAPTTAPQTCSNNWTPITWKNPRGTIQTASGSIWKPAGSTAWDSGATSTVSFQNDQCIDVQWNCVNGAAMIGLSTGKVHRTYKDIGVGVYCTGNSIAIYKSGKKVAVGLGSYTSSSVIRMTVNKETNYIWVRINGQAVYGTPAPGYPLSIGASLKSVKAKITNIKWAASFSRNCNCAQPSNQCQVAKCDDFGNCATTTRPDKQACGQWGGTCQQGTCTANFDCACQKAKCDAMTKYGPRCYLQTAAATLGSFIDPNFNPDSEFGKGNWVQSGNIIASKNGKWKCVKR